MALLALLLVAAPASAATITNQRPLLFSFDGSDTTAGKFELGSSEPFFSGLGSVASDYSAGSLYAVDATAEAVDRFDAEGQAEDFASGPAAGTSSLLGPTSTETFKQQNQSFFAGASLAVDNSGGGGGPGEGEQGRLYVVGGGREPIVDAFGPEGAALWSISPRFAEEQLRGITVDAQGHLWASFGGTVQEIVGGVPVDVPHGEVLEFDTTGAGAPSTSPIAEIEITTGTRLPRALAIDKSGESLYVASDWGQGVDQTLGLGKTFDRYLNGTVDSTLSTVPIRAAAVDQSLLAGHLFSVRQPDETELGSTLDEYEPCSSPGCGATLLSSSDPGLIGDGRGVAYNPASDWLYVPDHLTQTVRVFGPRASGPVPTVSEGETDEITKTAATAHGIVNPASLPNTYHFELVRAEVQKIVVTSTGGRFWIGIRNFQNHPITVFPEGVTKRLPFDISPAALQAELEPFFGAGNFEVTGTPAAGGAPGEYQVLFKNQLAGTFVPKLNGRFVEPFEEGEEGEPYKGGRSDGAHVDVTRSPQGQLWAQSEQQRTRPESYPGIEPTDSANHPVSLHFTGLRQNTPYDVRLVATNTEPEADPAKRLDAYSGVDTFTTLPPPPPDVSGLAISGVTTEAAHLSATIDPKEDETSWRALIDPAPPHGVSESECEALDSHAFELAALGTIPNGEPGPVPIETDLASLEPGETYCLRLTATNGGGSGQEDAVLSTEVVKPTGAGLAFVAPRTDTSARLNAYLDPQGDTPLTYQFEYSADAVTWTALPELVSTTDAHGQILFAEEIGGLTPDTTYFYRLALVKNEAGEIPPESLKAKTATFTTRTSAEMTLPADAFDEPGRRGIELVNNPDDGNQSARAAKLDDGASPLRADGKAFLWTVLGGAPGANSGTGATFLAGRGAAGWGSRSFVPPASQQIGGGGLTYYPAAVAPDFSSLVFAAALPAVLTTGPPTIVRLDSSGEQRVLHAYQSPNVSLDTTADLAHVLAVDPDSGKLEDIGTGAPEEVGLIPPPGAQLGVPQPGGSPPLCGLANGGESFAGPGNGGGASSQYQPGYHRIAIADASRVYFQVHPDGGGCDAGAPWAVYERNREAGPPTTTAIVTPAKATNDTAIIRATTDGRGLYFVTSASLDAADKNADPDIYRWEEPSGKSIGRSTCLTCAVKNGNGEKVADAKVTSNVLVSDDFSHLYFTSTNQLEAPLGIAGKANLYVLSAGRVHFVASPVTLANNAHLSTDGDVLTFLSNQPLTADPIAAQCPDLDIPGATKPCQELYRYDDRDASIECISCRHGATTANSVALTSFGDPYQVSADGSTLAFTTAGALVSLDVNQSADLYEWRNGAVRLITDGLTRYPIGLSGPIPQAIDPDGSSVVFSVASPGLTGFEQNGVANLYDARIGGGFTPPGSPAHCSEESCQGPLLGAPSTTNPTSSSYEGRGNKASTVKPGCRKGKVRRNGPCKGRHGHKRRGRATHAKRGRTR